MKKFLGYFLLLACLFCLGLGAGTWWRSKNATHKLTILHVNDTHSHLEPVRSGELAGMGGALERVAYIDSVMKADGPENVLLLHAGDFCQGTSYFAEFGAPLMVDVLNAMHYDAATLGNHEFDNGIEALGQALSKCTVPIVVCNYDFSPFEMGKYIKPYVIVEKAGLKIGIVGVLCSLASMVQGDTANRLPELDMVTSLQNTVDGIRGECDLVIALTHIGLTEHNPGDMLDPALVAATRGIDLFVGGHSHTFLDEPVYAKNLDGKRVPIVQDGWTGSYVGEIHMKL